LDLHERHAVVVTNDRPGGATPSEVLVRKVTLQSTDAVAYGAALAIPPAADSGNGSGIASQPAASVSTVGLASLPCADVPLAALQAADERTRLEPSSDGTMLLTTQQNDNSYAAMIPATAPRSGHYEFSLEYRACAGDISIDVLSGSRQCWLANMSSC